MAVGYAYPEGIGQYSGELVVARLAQDGSMHGGERVPRVETRVEHGCPEPTVLQMVRTPRGFALEVTGDPWRWWLYDGASASRVGQQQEAPAAVELPPASEGEAAPFPSVELAPLGHVQFPWPVPTDAKKGDPSYEEFRQRLPHRVCLDSQGRIWISELTTRIVHVFDPRGTPLFERAPDPAHFRPYRATNWITAREDGSLFVSVDDAVEQTGPGGERVGRTSLEEYLYPLWLFLPGTDRRWAVTSSGWVELQGTDGRVFRHHERGANGRWLEGLWTAATAKDGALAVLDTPGSTRPRDPALWVHLFTPAGDALRSLRLPDEVRADMSSEIAFERGRLALIGGHELWVLSEEGAPISHSTLPEEVGDSMPHLFFSPTGDELWVFPRYRAEMLRFASKP